MRHTHTATLFRLEATASGSSWATNQVRRPLLCELFGNRRVSRRDALGFFPPVLHLRYAGKHLANRQLSAANYAELPVSIDKVYVEGDPVHLQVARAGIAHVSLKQLLASPGSHEQYTLADVARIAWALCEHR